MLDEKALKTLFFRYWSANGWTLRDITTDEFEHAKQAGVMFDDVAWTHDEAIRRIRAAVEKLDPVQVAQQFVASLSSRRVDLRSALGSYAVGRHMPEHTHSGPDMCPVCGAYGRLLYDDLNILSFERHKWGGVRHLTPAYVAFDLECFLLADHTRPKQEDYNILGTVLDVVRALPPNASPNDAAKSLSKVVKSNDPERRVLLEILGYCSVLETSAQPGFLKRFITYAERPSYPPGSKNDWSYPTAWWKGASGVNEDAVRFFFPFM